MARHDCMLQDKAFEQIRRAIWLTQYQPGQILSETIIGRDLELPVAATRHALVRLQQVGLMKIVPRAGSQVSLANHHEIGACLSLIYVAQTLIMGTFQQLRQTTEVLNMICKDLQQLSRQPLTTQTRCDFILGYQSFHLEIMNATPYGMVMPTNGLPKWLNQIWLPCVTHLNVLEMKTVVKELRQVIKATHQQESRLIRQALSQHLQSFAARQYPWALPELERAISVHFAPTSNKPKTSP
jgi:DNA-binding GntR family transcriptional regulator